MSMASSTLHELYDSRVGPYYCVTRDPDPLSGMWVQFEEFWKCGVYCDLAIYCKAENVLSDNHEADDLLVLHDGDEAMVKILCHSIVLGSFSNRIADLLLQCNEGAQTSCQHGCDSRENYTLMLPQVSAQEILCLLDQLYSCLARSSSYKEPSGEVTMNLSSQLISLFNLKPDSVIYNTKFQRHQVNLIDVLWSQKEGNLERVSSGENVRTNKMPSADSPDRDLSSILRRKKAAKRDRSVEAATTTEELKEMAQVQAKKLRVVVEKLYTGPDASDPLAVPPTEDIVVPETPASIITDESQSTVVVVPNEGADILQNNSCSVMEIKLDKRFSRNPIMFASPTRQQNGAKRKTWIQKSTKPPEKAAAEEEKNVPPPPPPPLAEGGSFDPFKNSAKSNFTKFNQQTKLKLNLVDLSALPECTPDMLESIKCSQGNVTLVTADYDRNQIFTCTQCQQTIEEPGVERYLRHFVNNHKKKKARISCQLCGKEQLMYVNFISHVFRHKILDFEDNSNMIALLGVGFKDGKNVACTLACNSDEWDDANTVFNFFKMFEVTYKFSVEDLYNHFVMERPVNPKLKKGKMNVNESAKLCLAKRVYGGSSAEQREALLQKFLGDFPGMFTPEGSRLRSHVPQLPAFMFPVSGEFELVPGLSFDHILDVGIVFENKRLGVLEVLSVARMGFQCTPLTALNVRGELLVKMLPVLSRLLRCPDDSLNSLKEFAGDTIGDYFKKYEEICYDVLALRELVTGHPGNRVSFGRGISRPRVKAPCTCAKDLHNADGRRQHMMTCHGINVDDSPDARCDCTSSFRNVRVMVAHMRGIHNVEVPHFSCPDDDCCMMFTTKHQLDDHEKRGVHSVLTKCPDCTLVCSSKQAYDLHRIQKHKLYTCPNCGASPFIGKLNMDFHHTRCISGRWKCRLCKKIYENEEVLTEHVRVEHDQTRPPTAFCNICQKGFIRTEYMRSHERKVHKRKSLLAKRGEGKSKRTPKHQEEVVADFI